MNAKNGFAFMTLKSLSMLSGRGWGTRKTAVLTARLTMLAPALAVILGGMTTNSAIAGDGPLSFRVVALSGQAAPGTIDGAQFQGFVVPTIDKFGRTTFFGALESGGVTDDSNEGFWAERGGALSLVLREGDQVPGMDPGTVFLGTSPFPYPTSAGGATLFRAGVQFPDGTTSTNLWSNHSGVVQPVLPNNGQLPVPGGTAVPLGGISSLNISQSDHGPAFSVGAASAVIDPFGFLGIWGPQNGNLGLVAYTGQQVPELADGITFSSLTRPSVNSFGHVAFAGEYKDPEQIIAISEGIFLGNNGGVSTVVRAGDPVPGADPDAAFAWFHNVTPNVNDNGQVSFLGQWFSDSQLGVGAWAGEANNIRFVAGLGSPAPGMAAGVSFSSIQNSFFKAPPINAQGATAFHASLQGPGINNSNRDSIWSEGLGSLELVVREGSPAPGTDDGIVFGQFGRPSINGIGQVAFYAGIRDSSGAEFNNWGIWAQDTSGIVRLVAHVGMEIEVAPGDLRTIQVLTINDSSGGEDGWTRFLNDRGELATLARFTDNTSAILVFNVPEPASAVILLWGSLIILRGRNRRV